MFLMMQLPVLAPHPFGSHPPLFRQEGNNLLANLKAQCLGGLSAKSNPVKMPMVQIDLEQVMPITRNT